MIAQPHTGLQPAVAGTSLSASSRAATMTGPPTAGVRDAGAPVMSQHPPSQDVWLFGLMIGTIGQRDGKAAPRARQRG